MKIQLAPTEVRVNRNGKKVDNTLFLVRVDSNNLALMRGETIENYFGDVRTALTRSLNYAIKGSSEALTLENILKVVESMDETIKTLKCDVKDLK